MNTKLTLNVNKDVIEEAKKYAQSNNQSISALVQNYLSFITEQKSTKNLEDIKISKTVKELSGIIKVDESFNEKELYHKHIMEKYS